MRQERLARFLLLPFFSVCWRIRTTMQLEEAAPSQHEVRLRLKPLALKSSLWFDVVLASTSSVYPLPCQQCTLSHCLHAASWQFVLISSRLTLQHRDSTATPLDSLRRGKSRASSRLRRSIRDAECKVVDHCMLHRTTYDLRSIHLKHESPCCCQRLQDLSGHPQESRCDSVDVW